MYPLNNWLVTYRSSHRRFSIKKCVIRNFKKFTEKYLCQSLFLNKGVGLRPATLLKKRLQYRCFPVKFVKFLKHFFYRTPLVAASVLIQVIQKTVQLLTLRLSQLTLFSKEQAQTGIRLKQPLEVFCKKKCSQKIIKIHRKTPVPESFFAKFLRTPFLQNSSGRLRLICIL